MNQYGNLNFCQIEGKPIATTCKTKNATARTKKKEKKEPYALNVK